MLNSRIQQIEEAIGDPHFFDDFYSRNKASKYVYDKGGADVAQVSELPGKGYSLSIQIDPDNFNADELHRLVDIMAEVTKRLKKD